MALTDDAAILRDVVARVPELARISDLNMTHLVGGLSNRNYLVGGDGVQFVIRVAGENGPLLGVDRVREKDVISIVEAAGITPRVAAFVLPDGHAATRFVAEAHALSIDEFTSPTMVPRLAAKLRDVHGLGHVEGIFDPYADITRWMNLLASKSTPLPSRLEPLLDLVAPSIAIRPRPPEHEMVLCHNDPYHLNFLDNGSLWLIDWEYAGMNDPMYDLAGIGYTLDDQGRDLLLEAYFGSVEPETRRDLEALIPVYLCWNVVWSLVQIDGGVQGFDYFSYSEKLLDWMPALRI
ncbi:MAG: choline/ethanolamine kinase family protein [Actinomycetota bacterium]|nr:choline/ethanolamine kinase family protein [Actinomycetota bacterium]